MRLTQVLPPLSFVKLWLTSLMLTVMMPHNMAVADNAFTGLRMGSVAIDGADATRLVVEMSNPIEARLFLLDNPYRLVMDVAGAAWDAGSLLPMGSLNEGPIASYRYGTPDKETGRLVVELKGPAAPMRVFLLPPRDQGGHRIVIDLLERGPTAFKVAKAALAKQPYITEFSADAALDNAISANIVTAAPTINTPDEGGRSVSIAQPAPRPASFKRRWVVMVDAGHGGKDPGASGARGTIEKEVTLKAARILADKLNQTGRVRAVLTRDDDRYLKLRQRINLAREAQADLFISLHADAFHNPKAKGMSVFSLSDKASDKEAAYLAKRENQADLIGGPDLEGEDPLAATALLRMFQRESMNESAHLANEILTEIKDLPGGNKRGHRFAGFAVLKSPDIPSVLFEMGFLTNREEEAKLRSTTYLSGLADRLQRAIITYLEQSGR